MLKQRFFALIISAAESSNSQPSQTTPTTAGRRPANVLTTVSTSPGPTFASRRSSITTPKLVTSSGFRLSTRSEAYQGGSPRPATAPDCDHGLDDTVRPTASSGVVSMSASKSYDRDVDIVRGDGDDERDGNPDSSKVDPVVPQPSRPSSAKESLRSSESSGHGPTTSQRASKPGPHPHLGTKEENPTLNWNGPRSFSSRRSPSFDVPSDNNMGRSHSFSGLYLRLVLYCNLLQLLRS